MPEIKKLACKKCGHSWWPRFPGLPVKCPKCSNYNYWKPYKRKLRGCKSCGKYEGHYAECQIGGTPAPSA